MAMPPNKELISSRHLLSVDCLKRQRPDTPRQLKSLRPAQVAFIYEAQSIALPKMIAHQLVPLLTQLPPPRAFKDVHC